MEVLEKVLNIVDVRKVMYKVELKLVDVRKIRYAEKTVKGKFAEHIVKINHKDKLAEHNVKIKHKEKCADKSVKIKHKEKTVKIKHKDGEPQGQGKDTARRKGHRIAGPLTAKPNTSSPDHPGQHQTLASQQKLTTIS